MLIQAMLIQDRLKTLAVISGLLVPLGLAIVFGLETRLPRADFVFVNQGEVSSLDPAVATGIPEGRILMALYEGLTALDPETLKPIAACAVSWNEGDDGLTYTFRLRPGLAWSDGAPLTSKDFLFSWKRLLDPATASSYAYLLWDVGGAGPWTRGEAGGPGDPPPDLGLSAPDPTTFRVHLARPCPYFTVLTAFYPLFPVEEASLEDRGGGLQVSPDRPVTNGPFTVAFRRIKDRIRLTRNPRYWDRDRVGLDTVDALAVTSPVTALNLYLTGDVDWINHVPHLVLPFVKDREDFSLTPNLGTSFLRFNTTHPPLNDPRVRRAIHLAIDVSALSEFVLKGGQIPATSFVPPGIPGYTPPEEPNYDPEEARRLLAEAGFPGGEGFPELNLLYIANESRRDLTEVMVLMLRRELGIVIHPASQERKGYFVSQNSLAYHLCLCNWLGDYLDPSTFLDVFRAESGNNRTGWKDANYDRILDEAACERDPARRNRLLAEAETRLLKALPLAPLHFRTTSNMIRPEWTGYHDNIQDVHPLKYIRRRVPEDGSREDPADPGPEKHMKTFEKPGR